jgi:hypothetical protein
MLKINLLFILITFFTTSFLFAQGANEKEHFKFDNEKISNTQSIAFSGNLDIDNKIAFDAVQTKITQKHILQEVKDKKSPWLGAVFSLIVPGAGEFYAESYWKTGIFVAIEAAVITTAVIYNNKGNDQTNIFQNYADKNWSVVKYATWLNTYRGGNISINEDTSLPPWKRVNFDEIHEAENLEQNSDLSHNLAPHGDQQYYEMIGKYDQFASGWDDFKLEDHLGSTTPISPNFKYYSGLRGKANDYYSVASTAVIAIYLNHFLSAIDAYWSTTIYNKDLDVTMTVKNQRYADNIELVPTINLKFSF